MSFGEGHYAVIKFELINVVIMNECYLNNVDKYKYVAVVDMDETVLPRLTKKHFTVNETTQYLIGLNSQIGKEDVLKVGF